MVNRFCNLTGAYNIAQLSWFDILTNKSEMMLKKEINDKREAVKKIKWKKKKTNIRISSLVDR